jgi:hypothetical protein
MARGDRLHSCSFQGCDVDAAVRPGGLREGCEGRVAAIEDPQRQDDNVDED